MATQDNGTPIHLLEIPTTSVQFLVPSATIAEVVNVGEFTKIPQSPAWCIGAIAWRNRAVPIISFEALLGDAEPWIGPKSKILVFFPIPGRHKSEFFGVVSTSEPQPHSIVMTEGMLSSPPKDSRYIASAVNIRGRVIAIPDLEALKQAFYPEG